VHPFIHPLVRQSANCAYCVSVLHCARVETTRHPQPDVHRSPLDVKDITCRATPSHPRLSPCAYMSTRGAGASPDAAAILAPRWLRWVGLRGDWVCVAARVCTCICGYPFGICMWRSGATREVVLFRDAGSGVTGRMPRGCGTGEERTMVVMFKGWIVTITSMSCATNDIRITGIMLQRK
jgi:hypothetical protein